MRLVIFALVAVITISGAHAGFLFPDDSLLDQPKQAIQWLGNLFGNGQNSRTTTWRPFIESKINKKPYYPQHSSLVAPRPGYIGNNIYNQPGNSNGFKITQGRLSDDASRESAYLNAYGDVGNRLYYPQNSMLVAPRPGFLSSNTNNQQNKVPYFPSGRLPEEASKEARFYDEQNSRTTTGRPFVQNKRPYYPQNSMLVAPRPGFVSSNTNNQQNNVPYIPSGRLPEEASKEARFYDEQNSRTTTWRPFVQNKKPYYPQNPMLVAPRPGFMPQISLGRLPDEAYNESNNYYRYRK